MPEGLLRAARPKRAASAHVPPHPSASAKDFGTGPITVLAFDFGERFIGVAVGDSQTRLAHPLVTIDARSKEARFEQLGALIEEWRPALLVVGHPFSIDGERHDLTERAERFARQLGGRFRLPIRLIDERLTSAEAQRELSAAGRGGRADKSLSHAVAARIILESHFDERTA